MNDVFWSISPVVFSKDVERWFQCQKPICWSFLFPYLCWWKKKNILKNSPFKIRFLCNGINDIIISFFCIILKGCGCKKLFGGQIYLQIEISILGTLFIIVSPIFCLTHCLNYYSIQFSFTLHIAFIANLTFIHIQIMSKFLKKIR